MISLTNKFAISKLTEVISQSKSEKLKFKDSEISYNQVKPKTKIHRNPPLFMEGPIGENAYIKFFTENTELFKIGFYHIKHGIIFGKGLVGLPSGEVFTSPDLLVEEQHITSSLWKSPFQKSKDGYLYRNSNRKIREISEKVILLMKAADHIYGHWLVDILPKIILLQNYNVKGFKYIISTHAPIFAEKLLELAGVSQDMIIKVDDEQEDIYCQELVIPSVCRFRSIISPIANEIYDRMIREAMKKLGGKELPENPERKIYLSRLKWGNASRRMVNNSEVERCMIDNGFEIIFPEELTLVEQIDLFQKSSCIIGESGSALHNTVFSKPRCKVGVLQGNNNYNFLQSALGDIRHQKTGYLFGESFFRAGNGMNGDFLISVAQLRRLIKTFF